MLVEAKAVGSGFLVFLLVVSPPYVVRAWWDVISLLPYVAVSL
jgi:hypothetical protein